MRNALASTLFELAQQDDRIVVVVADISPAGAMDDFRRAFPDRFINVGVAEQAMVGIAAGLAQRGFKVFCYTIATFALYRAFEFIRNDLAYQNLPVTVVGMGAGLSYGTLGATHQAVEDVAVAVAMPNLTVLAPCDPAETAECARWCASRESGGPVYMRIGKAGEPTLPRVITWEPDLPDPREMWRAQRTRSVAREAIFSYGPITSVALEVAASRDSDLWVVRQMAPRARSLYRTALSYASSVVIEESSGAPLATQVRGSGAQVKSFALPREFCPLHGTREELLDHYGLTAEKIVAALRQP